MFKLANLVPARVALFVTMITFVFTSTLTAESILQGSSARESYQQQQMLVGHAAQYIEDNTIQLPQTGQTTCSGLTGSLDCAGTGQDGDIQAGVAWPEPRFVNHEDGTVTDMLTGLMWSEAGNTPAVGKDCIAGKKGWQAQLDYIACLNANNYKGYSDWRMPNVNEQKSLVNAGVVRTHIWLNNNGFASAQFFDGYFSSTTAAQNPVYVWVVPLDADRIGRLGTAIPDTKNSGHFVWPVRAGQLDGNPDPTYPANVSQTGQKRCWASTGFERDCAGSGEDGETQYGVAWPETRFSNNGDGTVRDNLTGLTWAQDAKTPGPLACVSSETMNWMEAFDYVACLNANNFLDRNTWRVPNWIEMMSLVDYGQVNAAVEPGHPFINLPVPFPDRAVTYHTSTTSIAQDQTNLNYNFVFDPRTGSQEAKVKGLDQYVWPVLDEAPIVHDDDEDGIPNDEDNCVSIPNANQADADGDNVGDVCDLCPGFNDNIDSDGDGVPNGCDVCPIGNDTADSDGDGIPNACDDCPDDNPNDSDGDGVCDSIDICHGHDDSIDDDEDGTPNGCDNCPLDPDKTTPGDCGCGVTEGTCEGCTSNDDCDDSIACTNDICDTKSGECIFTTEDANCDDGLYCNGMETCDELLGCQDGTDVDCTDKDDCTVDTCDEDSDTCSHEIIDSDDDGVCDANDICPGFDDSIDSDGDGIPNGCDVCHTIAGIIEIDSDGDGVCDSADICPGFDDNVDTDSDGVPNGCDPCPLHNPNDNEDGVCGPQASNYNVDRDDDGVRNAIDQCPDTTEGAIVDLYGCSCDQLDDDEDGVDNCHDECTDTIVSSEVVSEIGCDCSQLDCDDEDTCTTDTCEDGVCTNIAIDCPDDGLFCNGVEACNNGDCTSSGDPCGDNETCNEDTNTCDPDTPAPGQPAPQFNLCGNLGDGCTLTPPALILTFFGLFTLRFVGPRRKR